MKNRLFIMIGILLLVCNFFALSFTLTVDMDSAHGSVTVNGKTFTSTQYLTFYTNDPVTISASNDAGYIFEQWGAYYQGEKQTPFTFAMTEDVYVEPTWTVDTVGTDMTAKQLTVTDTSLFKGFAEFHDTIKLKPATGTHYQYTDIKPGQIDLKWFGNAATNLTLSRSGLLMTGLGKKLEFDVTNGLALINNRSSLTFNPETTELTILNTVNDDSTVIQGGKIKTENIDATNLSVNTINTDLVEAEEILVRVDAHPDYVFNDDYDLKSLDEVNAFIKTNGHLPGIPSENEALENGLKIGEMQTKLLEKIEELTLYMIEQNEEITKIKKQNEMLETQNAVQKAAIEALQEQL